VSFVIFVLPSKHPPIIQKARVELRLELAELTLAPKRSHAAKVARSVNNQLA
jgi:hypothetical protein